MLGGSAFGSAHLKHSCPSFPSPNPTKEAIIVK